MLIRECTGNERSWVRIQCVNSDLFWTVVLEKTLESPLDCKESQPVYPKGNQSWVFIGRTDVEAETSVLRPPKAKSWQTWKDPDAGKDWGRRRGWQRMKWLDGITDSWTWVWVNSRVGDGQGGLTCSSPWGRKELDMSKWLNWTELNWDPGKGSN